MLAKASMMMNDLRGAKKGQEISTPSILVVFLAIISLVVQLDIQHLILALIGASTYALLQLRLRKDAPPTKKACSVWDERPYEARRERGQGRPHQASARNEWPQKATRARPVAKEESNKPVALQKTHTLPRATPSAVPLSAPVFNASGWAAEVEELLDQIRPTPTGELVVQRIAQVAREAVRATIPEAEVLSFACGDISRGTAFGVAVPEVDILVRCNPDVLLKRLLARLSKGGSGPTKTIDARKLQKSAIRACTDLLVNAGFKFRRSAFRGNEPKVTLLAPSMDVSEEAIPVDFSVNSITPLYNATIMSAAAALDPRVLELGLLVKRWAKDRGICHAAKGHLPPYAWNVLAIFFLQVSDEKEQPMLPPMKRFDWSSCPKGQLRVTSDDSQPRWQVPEAHAGRVAPNLFKEFFDFYTFTFNWGSEAVSVRRGKRGPAPENLETHVITPNEIEYSLEFTLEGKREAVAVEDPFEPTKNLASYLSYYGLIRLKEELKRASNLTKSGASLSELLDPWVPPAKDEAENSDGEGGKKEVQSSMDNKGLEEALYARLRAHGDEHARRATAKLLEDLNSAAPGPARAQKAEELISLLQDENKLSGVLSRS